MSVIIPLKLASFLLLSETPEIMVYRTVLPLVLYESETWSLTFREARI
jgi:hypothetical protein